MSRWLTCACCVEVPGSSGIVSTSSGNSEPPGFSPLPSRLPLTFTYSHSGLPPGEYRLETVLRDMIKKKSHAVVTPIRIEGP